jgi:hypothetical protein
VTFSSVIGFGGAVVTGIVVIGEQGVKYVTDNPEILSVAGAAFGAPWAGPTVLGAVALWKLAWSKKKVEG